MIEAIRRSLDFAFSSQGSALPWEEKNNVLLIIKN
jgi:hypothetical protein